MVERLKASVEDLEPPTCPHCNLSMKWIRSLLLDAVEPQTIGHYFRCDNCGGVKETKSKVRTINEVISYKKLSKSASLAA
jgi:hypothetical protein